MEIRELREDDGLAYRDVRLRALRLAPEAFGATYEEEAAQTDAFWIDLVARTARSMESAVFALDRGDGTLAGTAYVRVLPDPPHDGSVGAMWLDEDLRGSGWAEALLGAAEKFARALGAGAVTLWVAGGNERARRFYARTGYISTGIEEPSAREAPTLLLRKDLEFWL
jgi:ribosomal protein S18 acetylase RimI-like enzyme